MSRTNSPARRLVTRWILALSLALSSSLVSGCFVADLLDEGDEMMEQISPTARAEADAKKKGVTEFDADAQPATAAELAQQWWSKATTLTPGNKADAVRCKVPSGTLFMTRSDCLARGGVPVRS